MRVTEKWREAIKAGELPKVQKVVIPEIKAPEGDSRTASFVISNGNEDRDGDVIEVAGWELGAFKENPVVLWAHDASQLPVAKATSIGVVDGNLTAEVEFPAKGMSPFADQVFDFVKGGFLRGASVGFQPMEAEPRKEGGILFKRQELFEFSILPIPAHREALAQAKAAGLEIEPVLEWAEKLLGDAQESGLWVPRFAMEKAIGRVQLEIKVNDDPAPAAPAAPPSEADADAGGHAAAGAGSDQDPKAKAPDDEPTEPETVAQIVARQEAERERMDNQWDLEMALAESIASIQNSDRSDEEKRDLIRQTAQEFVEGMVGNALEDEDDPPADDPPADPPAEDDEDIEELAKEVFPEDEPDPEADPDADPPEDAKEGSGVPEVDTAYAALWDPVIASLELEPEARAAALKEALEAFAGVVMGANAPEPEQDPEDDPEADPMDEVAAALEEEMKGDDLSADDLRDIVVESTKQALRNLEGRQAGKLPD